MRTAHRIYATHVGLAIVLLEDEEGFAVTINGDREKLLFTNKNEAQAEGFYAAIKAGYEERKKVESGNQ